MKKDITICKNTSVKAILLAILSSFAFCIQNGMHILTDEQKGKMISGMGRFLCRLSASVTSFDFLIFLVIILLAYLYYLQIPKINKKNKKIIIPISIIFALIFLLCDSYAKLGNWNNVFGNKMAIFTSFLKLTGISIIFFFILDLIFKININIVEKNKKKISWKKFLILTLIIVICWTPYFVIFYPACMNADASDIFAQATNNKEYCWSIEIVQDGEPDTIINNHHPVFHTFILSMFVKLGELIHSYRTAVGIYCIMQAILLAVALIFELMYLQKLGLSKKASKIIFLIFALNPIFPLWGILIVKDTLFTIFMIICTILFYDCFKNPNNFSNKKMIFLMFFVLLLILTRNNGVYLGLLMVPFVIIYYRKNIKFLLKILSTIIVPILIYKIVVTGIIFSNLGIKQGSPREMMSVPFQQTARYILENRTDITDEEEKNILNIFNTPNNSLDDIANEYKPTISDPVKGRYNKNATTEDWKNYVKVWWSQFLKHPKTYFEAFFHLNFNWFYEKKGAFIYYDGIIDKYMNEVLPGVKNVENFDAIRQGISQIIYTLVKIPIISTLFNYSIYTWIYLVIFIIMIVRKKKEELLACILLFGNYLIGFLGPVAYTRYAIPMMFCVPFVLFIVFYNDKDERSPKVTDEEIKRLDNI